MDQINSGYRAIGLALVLAVAGCSSDAIPWNQDPQTGRWYSQTDVEQGQQIFLEHCAQCHGGRAQGARNWNQPDAQGFYPPPPLNGTAHAWHHPYQQLMLTISNGTQGKMPAWQGTLSEQQISQTIAYFQSFWPEQGYQLWLKRHKH